MPKGGVELVAARRKEIIKACETLYETMGFKEITLKEIGKITSFTRTTIYNYFQSKEEIFLAILEREYTLWVADLQQLMADKPTLTADEFAEEIASTVEKRALLLKIMSMNHYDMEEGSRPEALVSFEGAYGASMHAMTACLAQYFPHMSEADRQGFIYVFFPFMFGIYPYTKVTDKQKIAMEEAGVNYVFMSIHELTASCVKRLLVK